jgi:phosphopantetheine adenylyltransferase
MKNFLQFFTEATAAADQAAKLGLVGDGHGGWYNRATGEFEAKTVGGKLKFYNKRQRVGKDPDQTEGEKDIPNPTYSDPALTQQTPVAQETEDPAQEPAPQPQAAEPQKPEMVPPPVEKTKGTLTIAFGRFNPPTVGHAQLLDTVAQAAGDEDFVIVPSRSQDKKKNPLDADAKVSYMRKMFPAYAENIVNDPANRTIFDVLKKAHNDGYTNVRIVGGADRVAEFEKLSTNYNGKLYQFDNIEVTSAGERDPDAEGIKGMSASKLRKAAAEGDFVTFRSGISPEMNKKETLELFNLIRQSMGIKEGWELWDIAPKLDYTELRENYVSKNIFNIGDVIENLNTGLSGKIIRRGTNYLICVTEDNIMFKSWIKDVTEAYTEKNMSKVERVPGKPNTLIGTDGYMKVAAMNNPWAIHHNTNLLSSYGKEFINKHRRKQLTRSYR